MGLHPTPPTHIATDIYDPVQTNPLTDASQ